MKLTVEPETFEVVFLFVILLVVCLPDSAFAASPYSKNDQAAQTFFHVHNKLGSSASSHKSASSLSSVSPTGLSPTQIRKAYNLPSTGGSGTIAIIDAFDCPTVRNDFVTFSRQYGLPTTNLEIHKMTPTIPVDANWALEISLDVQWAHAIAPNATILLVEAKSNSLGDLLAAVNYATSRPDVVAVSMSWGTSEFLGENTYDSYFNSPNGIVFFASSGDSGAGVIYPSASPNVVAVGGTRLTFNLDGTLGSETGWTGSGGGISAYETEPQFQLSYNLSGVNGKRAVPDVSYNADPNSGFSVYDTTAYQGQVGWFQLGGTSAGAPQWAAIHSLGLSSSNNNFYQDAKSNHSVFFRDVTTGSNGVYSASVGYDFVTGLGSPLTWNYSLGGGLNYSILAFPSALTLKNGTIGTSNLQLVSLNGFTGTVSLSANAPTGWIASFNSSSPMLGVGGSNSSVLSLTVPPTAKSGTSNVVINSASGIVSHSVSLSVTVQTVPSAPSSLNATGNTQVSLDWTTPIDNGGLPITSYNIYRGLATEPKTKIATVNGNIFHYVDNPPEAGQSYTYQVTANNSIGESAPSNEAITSIQLGTLNLTVSTDRPRYSKWSYVFVNIMLTDGTSGAPIQGALINASVSDSYGRTVWLSSGVTDTSGKIQFLYKLVFDAQMGTYSVLVSSLVNGYQQGTGQATFFSMG